MRSNNYGKNKIMSKKILFFILIITNFCFVITLFSQVKEEWVMRYNGPGNDIDWAEAIAVDEEGNVYITGGSCGSETGSDCTTIKYNSEGLEQWVVRYTGPGTHGDKALDLVLDSETNVYITGYSYDSGTGVDYVTIKYNSAGEEQWVARYNGSENSGDYACDMVIDNNSNIYVTGYTNFTYPGDSTDSATIKYDKNGVEQWVAEYNGPVNGKDATYAIALDSGSNVYVTGGSEFSENNEDYITIKYNELGVEQWVVRYNGPGNGGDGASDMVLDNEGNIYITGRSIGLGTAVDYATIKYNNSGVEQWVARYNGPKNGVDRALAIALDSDENVCITGYINLTYDGYYGYYTDYATIKYDSNGVEQWIAIYNGNGNLDDRAFDMCADKEGNIYVTGYSYVSNIVGQIDYATIKYNKTGTEQWIATYDFLNESTDWARAITLDSQNNVYITGTCLNYDTSWDYATIKYSQSTFSESFYLY